MSGGDEPLQIVCGADNISAGDLVPVAMVGAVLPGDRRIERIEDPRRRVAGDALLRDRAGPGRRRGGNPHPGRRRRRAAARGADLRPHRGRGGAGRGRQAEPRRRPVDGRPGARGGRHHRLGAAPAGASVQEDPSLQTRGSRLGRDRRPRRLPALHGPLVRGRAATAPRRPGCSAGCWPPACGPSGGGGRHQLRHARAGSADARV